MEKIINIEKINRAVMTGTPEEVIELCRFIHIESCFDYVCDPPADFLEQCEKNWSGRSSFCGTVERKIGNTWCTVAPRCDGNEPWSLIIRVEPALPSKSFLFKITECLLSGHSLFTSV